jgi:hypothetical protein
VLKNNYRWWCVSNRAVSVAAAAASTVSFHVGVSNTGGSIQNIPDLCRHPYSSCCSAQHRYMVGLPCLVSQCAKLLIADFTAISGEVYIFTASVRNSLDTPCTSDLDLSLQRIWHM